MLIRTLLALLALLLANSVQAALDTGVASYLSSKPTNPAGVPVRKVVRIGSQAAGGSPLSGNINVLGDSGDGIPLEHLLDAGDNDFLPGNTTTAESYGASPSANYATNYAAIQAALNVGGEVSITKPGTYQVYPSLVIGSNTHLYLGAGVTLQQASQAARTAATQCTSSTCPALPMFINNAFNVLTQNYLGLGTSNAILVGTGNMTSSGQTVTVSGLSNNPFTAGDYVAVGFAGTKGYNGTWLVTGATSTSITFDVDTVPAASPAVVSAISATAANLYPSKACVSTGPTLNICLFKVDVNISITGKGTLDYNASNIMTGAAGNQNPAGSNLVINNNANIFFAVQNLYIGDGLTCVNAQKYCYHAVHVRKAVFNDLKIYSNSDGVHLNSSTDVDVINPAV